MYRPPEISVPGALGGTGAPRALCRACPQRLSQESLTPPGLCPARTGPPPPALSRELGALLLWAHGSTGGRTCSAREGRTDGRVTVGTRWVAGLALTTQLDAASLLAIERPAPMPSKGRLQAVHTNTTGMGAASAQHSRCCCCCCSARPPPGSSSDSECCSSGHGSFGLAECSYTRLDSGKVG